MGNGKKPTRPQVRPEAEIELPTTWRPKSPEPPDAYVTEASNAVLPILRTIEPRQDGEIEEPLGDLIKRLEAEGHSYHAAEWAIYRHIEADLLSIVAVPMTVREVRMFGKPTELLFLQPGIVFFWTMNTRSAIWEPEGQAAEQDATTAGKGVVPRQEWCLKEHEARGMETYKKPAKIFAKWNALPLPEREKICADEPSKMKQVATVSKDISLARKARGDKPRKSPIKRKLSDMA